MGKYVPPEKMTVEQMQANIDSEFARWEEIYKNGCSDPTWHDGVNLELVRNHIIYWYRLLDEKEASPVQLTLFDALESFSNRRPLPPVVDNKYMAKPDELRANAKRTLEVLQADENYLYLCALGNSLSAAVKKKVSYDNVIYYTTGLARMIESDELPRLRIYQNTAYWVNVYAETRKRIEDAILAEQNSKFVVPAGSDEDTEREHDIETCIVSV